MIIYSSTRELGLKIGRKMALQVAKFQNQKASTRLCNMICKTEYDAWQTSQMYSKRLRCWIVYVYRLKLMIMFKKPSPHTCAMNMTQICCKNVPYLLSPIHVSMRSSVACTAANKSSTDSAHGSIRASEIRPHIQEAVKKYGFMEVSALLTSRYQQHMPINVAFNMTDVKKMVTLRLHSCRFTVRQSGQAGQERARASLPHDVWFAWYDTNSSMPWPMQFLQLPVSL